MVIFGNFDRIRTFRKFDQNFLENLTKLEIFENLTKMEIFRTFWNKDQNRNFGKFEKSKFSKI